MFGYRKSSGNRCFTLNLAVCALAAFICGCEHSPVITTPVQGGEQPSTRTIAPIASVLKDRHRAVIVLVHGVGEHCPGFGLDGWLGSNADKFGLQVAGNPERQSINLYNAASVREGPHDPGSIMTLTREHFVFTTAAMSAAGAQNLDPEVDVAEITWSGIGEWLKLDTLAEDFSGAYKYDCVAVSATPSTTSLRGSRAVLTRDVKEGVIDHSLSDALIYVGPYGDGIQETLKRALCLVATNADLVAAGKQVAKYENPGCNWQDAKEDTRFVFVTHSLGSRIVFDAAFDLRNDIAQTEHDLSRQRERDATEKPIVTSMLCRTSAIYMFANQLPLIALTYAQRDAQSGDKADIPNVASTGVGPGHEFGGNPSVSALAPENALTGKNPSENRALRMKVRDSHIALKRLRRTCPGSMPEIVAFSDPDDLLSYGIPYRYTDADIDLPGAMNQSGAPNAGSPGDDTVHVTNVYVHNHFNWFGLLEAPGAAHEDYFVNSQVQDVVRCGMNGSTVVRCAK